MKILYWCAILFIKKILYWVSILFANMICCTHTKNNLRNISLLDFRPYLKAKKTCNKLHIFSTLQILVSNLKATFMLRLFFAFRFSKSLANIDTQYSLFFKYHCIPMVFFYIVYQYLYF